MVAPSRWRVRSCNFLNTISKNLLNCLAIGYPKASRAPRLALVSLSRQSAASDDTKAALDKVSALAPISREQNAFMRRTQEGSRMSRRATIRKSGRPDRTRSGGQAASGPRKPATKRTLTVGGVDAGNITFADMAYLIENGVKDFTPHPDDAGSLAVFLVPKGLCRLRVRIDADPSIDERYALDVASGRLFVGDACHAFSHDAAWQRFLEKDRIAHHPRPAHDVICHRQRRGIRRGDWGFLHLGRAD